MDLSTNYYSKSVINQKDHKIKLSAIKFLVFYQNSFALASDPTYHYFFGGPPWFKFYFKAEVLSIADG